MKIIIASCVIVQCALVLGVIDLQDARKDHEKKIKILMSRDETQPAFEAQLVNIHSNMCSGCAELKK